MTKVLLTICMILFVGTPGWSDAYVELNTKSLQGQWWVELKPSQVPYTDGLITFKPDGTWYYNPFHGYPAATGTWTMTTDKWYTTIVVRTDDDTRDYFGSSTRYHVYLETINMMVWMGDESTMSVFHRDPKR